MHFPYLSASRIALLMLVLPGWLPLSGIAAEAKDPDAATVQFHGFASQALISTTDNNFFGNSDDGISTAFTELGLNASWRATPNWTLAGQLVSRRAGEGDDGHLRLDYGFAHFNQIFDDQDQWGILLGKTKLPYGFYNETRDVAFTRPSILLPQSIYFDRSRDLVMAITGGQAQGSWHFGRGHLRAQVAAGRSEVDDKNIEYAFFMADRPGSFKSLGTAGSRLEYEMDDGQARLAITYGNMQMRYEGLADPLFNGGEITLEPWILSAQWNGERLSLAGEVARQKRVFKGFLAPINSKAHSLAYYLQGTYRASPNLSFMLRRDVFYADENDKGGQLQAIPFMAYSKDWTLGIQYLLTPAWMLAAEWHRVQGTFQLPLADNPNLGGLQPNWDMLLLQASYRF